MTQGTDAITLPKKQNSKQCQNYRAISLINHLNKAMLKVIQNRTNTTAEELLAEQAGFRPDGRTV